MAHAYLDDTNLTKMEHIASKLQVIILNYKTATTFI